MPIKPKLADDIAQDFPNLRQELADRAGDAGGLPALVLTAEELAEFSTEQDIVNEQKKLEKKAVSALRRGIAMALKDDDPSSADAILAALDFVSGGVADPQDSLRANCMLSDPDLMAATTPLREIGRIYHAAAGVTVNQVRSQKTVRDILDLVLGTASGRLQ